MSVEHTSHFPNSVSKLISITSCKAVLSGKTKIWYMKLCAMPAFIIQVNVVFPKNFVWHGSRDKLRLSQEPSEPPWFEDFVSYTDAKHVFLSGKIGSNAG